MPQCHRETPDLDRHAVKGGTGIAVFADPSGPDPATADRVDARFLEQSCFQRLDISRGHLLGPSLARVTSLRKFGIVDARMGEYIPASRSKLQSLAHDFAVEPIEHVQDFLRHFYRLRSNRFQFSGRFC